MESDKELVSIPLICKENSDQRYFKIIKLLVILTIVSNILWASSWIVYWMIPQSSQTVTQDSDGNGINNYIGNDSDIYGETDSDN